VDGTGPGSRQLLMLSLHVLAPEGHSVFRNVKTTENKFLSASLHQET
jgi:hypothetical protein